MSIDPEKLEEGKWKAGAFLVALPNGPCQQDGHSYRGLGLHSVGHMDWRLTHLNTGHAVCSLKAGTKLAVKLATEIAECADWTFDGLAGWQNSEPDLASKFGAVMHRHPRQVRRESSEPRAHEEIARQISTARAA